MRAVGCFIVAVSRLFLLFHLDRVESCCIRHRVKQKGIWIMFVGHGGEGFDFDCLKVVLRRQHACGAK